MRSSTKICERCGDEFEPLRRGRTCGTCKRIERMEKEALREWEHEIGGDDE